MLGHRIVTIEQLGQPHRDGVKAGALLGGTGLGQPGAYCLGDPAVGELGWLPISGWYGLEMLGPAAALMIPVGGSRCAATASGVV